MPAQTRIVSAVAAAAAALGFAVGVSLSPGSAGAAPSDANTPILRSINRQLATLNASIGRTPRQGVWHEVEDSKDFLRSIERNTRR